MVRFIKRCWTAGLNRIMWMICRALPIDRKKITIISYYGRGYGDNPKYIVEELLKSDDKLRLIWLVKNDDEKTTLPKAVKACKIDSLKSLYHLATSKIWIDNCRKTNAKYKRKNQFYIQTWHGFALKRIEKDAESKLSPGYVKGARIDSKHIDCIISCSDFMSEIYRNAFWYNGKILKIGAPRNDIFINGDAATRDKVFTYYNINQNKKIVLYAPTFRADWSTDAYSIDYQRLLSACKTRFGCDFVVLTRFHPNIAALSQNFEWSDNIINASYYSDMQELMVASDIIITDYSSVMFDFALTYKPCFQFATDIDAYKDDRNFYFELDHLPFTVSKNNDELERDVLNFDDEQYKKDLDEFYSKVGMIRDGLASKKCAELIINKCKEV